MMARVLSDIELNHANIDEIIKMLRLVNRPNNNKSLYKQEIEQQINLMGLCLQKAKQLLEIIPDIINQLKKIDTSTIPNDKYEMICSSIVLYEKILKEREDRHNKLMPKTNAISNTGFIPQMFYKKQ
jgi:endonuclease III